MNGFTGRGAVRYLVNKRGAKKLSVQLHGLAGRKAEIIADDTPTATVTIKNGRGDAVFASGKGHTLPDMHGGARIDIHQNGDVILSGVLTRK